MGMSPKEILEERLAECRSGLAERLKVTEQRFARLDDGHLGLQEFILDELASLILRVEAIEDKE